MPATISIDLTERDCSVLLDALNQHFRIVGDIESENDNCRVWARIAEARRQLFKEVMA